MKFTPNQLDQIASTIPVNNPEYATVRWLFQLFRDGDIDQKKLEKAPAFIAYRESQKKIISEVLLSDAKERERIEELNAELLQNAFKKLKQKYRDSVRNETEYMKLSFEQFHGVVQEYQAQTFPVLKSIISDICIGTNIWIDKILHVAHQRLIDAKKYDENKYYYLAFFLTSDKTLIAVIGTDYDRTNSLEGGGKITLTGNFSDILKIVTDQGIKNADGTIEDTLWPIISDEQLDDTDFDDYSYDEDDDEEDDEW